MGTKVGIRRISTPSTLSVPPAESVSKRIRLRAPVIVMQMLLRQVFNVQTGLYGVSFANTVPVLAEE